jgi:hypothetical protein
VLAFGDWTGSVAAGFYMVAIADVITIALIVLLSRTPIEQIVEA